MANDGVLLQRRVRFRRFPALLLLVALALLPLSGAPAAAQEEAPAAVSIERLRQPSGAEILPLRVEVVSRRALDAELVVRAEGTNVSWQLPLALAANNEVSQLVGLPITGGFVRNIEAALVVDGEEVASARAAERVGYLNAVGLIGLAAPGEDIQLEHDLGPASVSELSNLALLSAFDTVVASPAGLGSLTEVETSQLLGWVATGQQLVVADEPGSIDTMLPEQWRAGGETVLADTGVIRYVGQDWTQRIPPSPSASVNLFQFEWFDASPRELINDAGFRVPGISGIGLLLVAYVLIAGPLMFAVLNARDKQRLAWIAIPALAALFTLGVFGIGRLFNSGRTDAHATIAEVHAAGTTIRDTFLLSDSGTETVDLPQGWYLYSPSTTPGFDGQAGSPVIVRPSRTSTELEFGIEAGSAGTGIVIGTEDRGSVLSFEDLAIDGDSVRGSVRNQTGVTLENVAVMVGNRFDSIGSIEDGQTGAFEFAIGGNARRFGPELNAWDVDPRQGRFFGPFDGNDEEREALSDGPTNGLAWLNWRSHRYDTAVPDGALTVVGWSRDLDYSIVDGRGRTAVVARTQLPDSPNPLLPSQVRRLIFSVGSNGGGGFGFDEPVGGFDTASVAQFLVPANADVSQLALDVPRAVQSLELWVENDGWRAFDLTDAANNTSLMIPASAWDGGQLTVRYQLDRFFGGDIVIPELEVLTDRSEDLEFSPIGEVPKRSTEGDFGFEPGFGEPNINVDHGLRAVEPNLEEFVEGEVFGSFDTLSLELEAGDVLEVRMTSSGCCLDPYLILLDENNFQVADNDDDGRSTNSLIRYDVDDPGVYTIEARPLGNSPEGGFYTLSWIVERGDST